MGDDSGESEECNEELYVIWENESCEGDIGQENEAVIFIHALTGSRGTNTIKIQGKIKNMVVTILNDSGSTHNFIAQGLAKQLRLPISNCKPFFVTVANGDKLNYSAKCNSVRWHMVERNFTTEMNIIPVGV